MGLGNVGLPVAKHIYRYFSSTFGCDINEKTVARELIKGLKAYQTAEQAEVYVICVNTYYRNHKPDMTAVYDCCRKINDRARYFKQGSSPKHLKNRQGSVTNLFQHLTSGQGSAR